MKPFDLPPVRTILPLGAIVERQDLDCTIYWMVTVFGISRLPRRRWFTSRGEAIAYAASQADEHGLPILDNCDPAEIE